MKYKKEFYTRDIKELIKESEKELKKLEEGVPLHKVLGYIEMTGLKIHVDKNVLIPRYETEELVYLASEYITKDSRVLDLCTGSGYISLAIKKLTNATVVASDISKEAIEQAKINAKINELDVEFVESDLFNNIEGKFDVIVSNPPYIPQNNKLSNSVLDYEPHLALFGGEDGNYFYKKIVKNMSNYLVDDGIILFEISDDNADFFKANNFEIKEDINGKIRFAILK